MGQKVNPIAFRVGVQKDWHSHWYADARDYPKLLAQDLKIRQALMEKLKKAGITKVEIERSLKSITIRIFVSRPGVVIGRGGSGITELKKYLLNLLEISPDNPRAPRIDLPIEEVKNPSLNAHLVATRISEQLERRMPHRRVVHKTISHVMAAGALGIKVVLSGRIAGAEIGRTEKYTKGSIPSQTIRADIDYAKVPALTRSGYIGVKVWIHRK
jgi:small subunit ribosomal protein S3